MTETIESSSKTSPSRMRTVIRVFVGIILCLALLAVGTWKYLTGSSYIINKVTPQLEAKLGGDVSIQKAVYLGEGRIELRNFTLRAPDHTGEAAEILSIGSAVISIDELLLNKGEVLIRDIELDSVVFRISESAITPGAFNYHSLKPDWSREDETEIARALPRVKINSAVVELGMHVGDAYTQVGKRRVAGLMIPILSEEGTYSFELQELDEHNRHLGNEGLVIKGQYNVQTLSHSARIDGLILDKRAFAMCPLMARIWCKKMGLEGRVEYATIQRGDDGIMIVELNIEDVGMTLPLGPTDFWARIRNGKIEKVVTQPRMRVKSGQIKLHGDRLTFSNLTGHIGGEDESDHLVSVPYRIELTTEELPTLEWEEKEQWLEDVLSSAPFHMRIWTDEFILPKPEDGVEPAVELPYQIALLMERFKLKGWGMSTEIDISRKPPTFDGNGDAQASPIITKGQASITQASGAYHKFPYALDGINGYLEFDNEKVTIVEMNGLGSDDTQVSISGTISPPGKDAAVTLNLIARNVPLDSRFRAALKGHERTTFDSMLHQPSYAALEEAGSLVDEKAIKRADRELIEAKFALDEIRKHGSTNSTNESAGALQKKIVRLQKLIAVGPFNLGGTVDLDLMIQRPQGADKRTAVTGKVTVHSAGVLYSRFPYPITVNQSTIVIERDRVTMGDGLKITTAGLGKGLVTGEVMLGRKDQDKRAKPNLRINVQGDELNELLFAAIPEAELLDSPKEISINPGNKSNSVAGRILQALGITGQISYSGTVTANDQGVDEFDFTVKLADGVAAPGDDLVEIMRESGMLWPPGFTLENVKGEFQVTPSIVKINNLTGTRGDGRIAVDGTIGIGRRESETDISARFENLAVEQYLVNLLPGKGDSKVADLWNHYKPHGVYDAQLRYVAIEGDKPQPHLVVQPKKLGIIVNEEDIDLICEKGELALVDGKVVFEDLAIRMMTNNRDDGLITLEGSYGIAEPDHPLRLNGKWSEGRLETAIIAAVMDLIGAKAEAKRYISYKPNGTFSAAFNYQSPVGKEPASFLCSIEPHDVEFVLNETQLAVSLEEESKITFLPDRVILENVAGSHDAGSFRIDGSFEIGDAVVAELEFEYLGWINRPELLEFLPASVRLTFNDLSFDATEQVHLKNGYLHLIETRFDDGVRSIWETRFDGLIIVRGGKFDAGVALSGIDGTLDMHIVNQPNLPLQMNLYVDLAHAKVLGRELSDATALIVISEDGKQVLLKDLRADVCGGLVTAHAVIDLKPASEFEYFLELAGVDLSLLSVSSDEDNSFPEGSLPSGDLYGSLSVAGDKNNKSIRRGRGAMRVVDARLASMPLGLKLIQILQFMPPVNESLDYADSKFFITGDRVVFERLSLECSTLQLIGEGEMNFDTFELDLRFRPRGTFEPLRDIIGGINDQLMAIKVTGPLSDPKSSIIALPGLSSKGPSTGKKGPKVANVLGHAD